MKRIHAAAAIVALSLFGVSLATGQQEGAAAGSPEVWGGQHVSLVMSSENATFEFDCAQGVITTPIKADAGGNFSAAGTYTPQRGGPVFKNNPPRELPATYKGTIQGNTMHLEVLLADKDQQPPPMTLTRGKAGRVVKCR